MKRFPTYFEYLVLAMRGGRQMHESVIAREMRKLFERDGRPVPAEFARAINSALQTRCETASEYQKRGSQGGFSKMNGNGYWSYHQTTLDDVL